MIEYPIHTDVFEFFIASKGFTPKFIKIRSAITEYEKDGVVIEINHVLTMTKNQVEDLLALVNIPLSDFEQFVLNNSPSGLIKGIVEKAIKTPRLKKKK